jgi:DNA-binding IclR family transcriptional regulator
MKSEITLPKAKNEQTVYPSPAVDKAVDVIEYLASLREGVSITKIAAGVNMSVGQIYRTVRALERRRLVYKNPTTDRFQLSLRLFELAHKFPPVERLIGVAQVELDVLSKSTLQSCHLAVTEGTNIVIIAAKESPLPMYYGIRVGSVFDMFETSSGTVISAFTSASQRELLLKSVQTAARPGLEERFEQIVKCGYEIHESDTVDGLKNISVPVRSKEGKIIAALTTPFVRQAATAIDPEAVLKLQLAASKRISRGLG